MPRYSPLGNTRMWFVDTLIDVEAPTESEINDDATELTGDIREMSGWSTNVTRIPTPDLASEFESQIGGSQKVTDSSLRIYLYSDTNALRDLLQLRTEGFIIRCDYLPGGVNVSDGDLVDVFPVVVIGTPKTFPVGDEAATWEAQFAITDPPQIDIAVAS